MIKTKDIGTHVRETDPWPENTMKLTLTSIATDNAEVYHGAPVGLQLIGRRYEEEKIWAIAKIVERVLEREGIV